MNGNNNDVMPMIESVLRRAVGVDQWAAFANSTNERSAVNSPNSGHFDDCPPQNGHNSHSGDSPSSSDSGGSVKKGDNSRPNRDPMSHRIIEKRRRDRMNNCLTNLSKLVPSSYLKKGRGRIEKTEIIEMAIRYMCSLQDDRNRLLANGATSEPSSSTSSSAEAQASTKMLPTERYKQGFYDCIAETLRFLAVSTDLNVSETTKSRLLVHLKDYFSQLVCDTLGGPIFAQFLASIHSDDNLDAKFSPDSSDPPKDDADEQPLNMSLKKRRLSSLRDILTDGPERKSAPNQSVLCCCEAVANISSTNSSHYPSSPSSHSHQSISSSSAGESSPRVLSPGPVGRVPVFALHSTGLFYVPLTLTCGQIDQNHWQRLTSNSGACHPITISVSFCPNHHHQQQQQRQQQQQQQQLETAN